MTFVLAVAREFLERALTLARSRKEARRLGAALCDLIEMQDFTEYHVLHGSTEVDNGRHPSDE